MGMRVRDWRRGWQERSKLQRIDLYSRFTVSVLPWIFTLSWDLAPFSSDIRRDPLPLTLGGVLLLVGLGQCVLSNRNVKPSYDHCLGRSVFPGAGWLRRWRCWCWAWDCRRRCAVWAASTTTGCSSWS